MVTFAICGCGNRGLTAYTEYQKYHPDKMKVVAGADIRPERIELLQEMYQVPASSCFASDMELLSMPKLADVMLISTPDRLHVKEALAALDLDYDILLEKPISPDIDECRQLLQKAKEVGRTVTVCHVLRYSPFYSAIKDIIDAGDIGRILTIDMTENVGYWHYCHSFVRGNWRNSILSSPMILQKCCHDLDLMRWFADTRCLSVQSYGAQSFFNKQNTPEGSSERCLSCRYADTCIYSAKVQYILDPVRGVKNAGNSWPVNVVADVPTEESVLEALKNGPYGRCVFACDNDVVDHQTLSLRFENDIFATFTMSAFSEKIDRTIKITGTKGELFGTLSKDLITVKRFGMDEKCIDTGKAAGNSGHGGGDLGLAAAFVDMMENRGENRTSLEASIESHLMAFAAEESRKQDGELIRMDAFLEDAYGK